jgi:hypothetical protein
MKIKRDHQSASPTLGGVFMSIEQVNLAAPFLALVLLFLCILLFTTSVEKAGFRPFLRPLLYLCGIGPGFIGVVAGFWLFVTRSQPLAIGSAFLLLELGGVALLRVAENSGSDRRRKLAGDDQ